MSQVFDLTSKTGDIVTTLPQASVILKKYKIDFCCGGNRSIEQVAAKQHLNADAILQELNDLHQTILDAKEEHRNWSIASNQELIEEIVGKHHAYLKQHLPDISAHVTKILKVHGDEEPELQELHRLFHAFKADMEQHMIAEENEEFPLFLAYEQAPTDEVRQQLAAKIQGLEAEHEQAGELLRQMRAVTNDYTLPLMACMTYALTFKKLEELESDMFQHVHLENNILFKRV